MNFWNRIKEGITTFLAGTLLFSNLNAMPIASVSSSVLDFAKDVKKEENIDYKTLDFLIHEENVDLSKGTVMPAYISPPDIFSFGKNKMRGGIDWKGLEIDNETFVYFDKKLEGVGNIEASMIKDIKENYIKLFNHVPDKDIKVFLYNGSEMRKTNLIGGILPENIGGFFEFMKWNVVVPWRDNKGIQHVTAHELAHVFLTEKIYEKQMEAWKLKYLGRVYEKNFILPIWFNEGTAEWASEGMSKEARYMMLDLVNSGKTIPVYNFPYSYPMYKVGQAFLSFLENNYGREKFTELTDNWYSFFYDVNETVKGEDIFGNEIEKKKIDMKSWALPLAGEKRVLNHAFEKVYGKNLVQLDKEFWEYWKKMAIIEIEKRDKIEDISSRLCPEVFAVNPTFNGNSFAYIAPNKNKTKLEIKVIRDNFDTSRESKDQKYKIIKIGEGSHGINSIKTMFGGMDMNKEFLVFPGKVDGYDNLFMYNLEKNKLEKKEFKGLIEIMSPTISHDNKYVAFAGLNEEGQTDIYVYNREKNELKKHTNDIYFEKDLDFAKDSYDLVYSSDKSYNGNYDIFLMKNFETVEKIINNESDDIKPKFTPQGYISFITSYNGIDNLFALIEDEDDGEKKLYQLTNSLNPIIDFCWEENKHGENKILVQYFKNMSYNIAGIKEMEFVGALMQKTAFEKKWEYKKQDFKEKKFRRKFGFEQGVFGAGSNGVYLGAYLTDQIRDIHLISTLFLDLKKPLNSDISFLSYDLSKKTPYGISFERFIYTTPEKWHDDDSTTTYPYPEETMNITKAGVTVNYPLNFNDRISGTFSALYSNKNSKDFFDEAWQEFYFYEELYPEFWKGFRLENIVSFTSDRMTYNYGPVEGHGLKLNLRTKINPSGLEKITSVSVDGGLRKYIKLGNFGVFGIKLSGGYGFGDEFEQFGVGGVRTIRGYGKNKMGTVPQFYGNGYYLFNAELSKLSLIKSIILPGNIAMPGIDGMFYVDIGNRFDDLYKIKKPKASIGFGLSSRFILPMNLYFSIPLDRGKVKTQFSVGYNF